MLWRQVGFSVHYFNGVGRESNPRCDICSHYMRDGSGDADAIQRGLSIAGWPPVSLTRWCLPRCPAPPSPGGFMRELAPQPTVKGCCSPLSSQPAKHRGRRPVREADSPDENAQRCLSPTDAATASQSPTSIDQRVRLRATPRFSVPSICYSTARSERFFKRPSACHSIRLDSR